MSTGTPWAPWLDEPLAALSQADGHAWLISGAAGLGHWALGQRVAKSWLCDSPLPNGQPCDECTACHAVNARTHPDFQCLLPDELALADNWPLDAKLLDKLEKKEVKPSKWIRVDSVRSVLSFAQTTPSRRKGKVVLVYPAHRLNVESANTLLKTLEEPPDGMRFLLVSEAAHQLLPTVRSRCLTHRLTWPSEVDMRGWLTQQLPDLTERQAGAWLTLSGGLPFEALAMAQSGADLGLYSRLPEALLHDADALLAWWSKAPPAQVLNDLQKVAHDALSKSHQAPTRYFDAAVFPDALRPHLIAAWAMQLVQQKRTVEHPFSQNLMLEAWLGAARAALAP